MLLTAMRRWISGHRNDEFSITATSLTHIEEDKPNRKGWHISYTQRKLTLEIAKSSIFYGMLLTAMRRGIRAASL